jgi:hypothetical protein
MTGTKSLNTPVFRAGAFGAVAVPRLAARTVVAGLCGAKEGCGGESERSDTWVW